MSARRGLGKREVRWLGVACTCHHVVGTHVAVHQTVPVQGSQSLEHVLNEHEPIL
jgi:hypothetical protein